jgi:hypothetical protein
MSSNDSLDKLIREGKLRPDDGEQHKTTFLAAGMIMGSEFDDIIRKIQKFRKKECVHLGFEGPRRPERS